jgi:hypothetical protein
MRMDEHTRGTLRFWREATPTHDIKFAAGKLQTLGTVDRHFRKFPLQKRVPSSHILRAVLGTPHGPKLSFTAISISCSEPRTSAPGSSGRGRQKFFGLLAGQPIPQPGTLLAHVGDVGPTSNHIVIVSRPELRRSAASSMTARSFEVAPGDGDLFLKVGSPSK